MLHQRFSNVKLLAGIILSEMLRGDVKGTLYEHTLIATWYERSVNVVLATFKGTLSRRSWESTS
jgi:hypothetical protein